MRRLLILALLASACQAPTSSSTQALDGNSLPILMPPVYGEQISIGPFDVPAGTEVQLCRTLKLSNTTPIAVNRLEVALNEGSHHFILFRSHNNQPFEDQTFPCWGTINFDDWEFVEDVNVSGGFDWPLDEGQAFIFPPNAQIMIQSHFVNATTVQSPQGGGARLNLYQTDPTTIQHPLYGTFTVDTNIDIPPHSYYSTNRTCTFSDTVKVVAMTGHFHSRGLTFKVWRNVSDVNESQIYESDNWNAPPFEIFPSTFNLFNGYGEDGVNFECTYYNSTDNTIGWGGHADTQEHCNLFFQYYDYCAPGSVCPPHQDLACAEGSGGW